jgi:hypothetical protein
MVASPTGGGAPHGGGHGGKGEGMLFFIGKVSSLVFDRFGDFSGFRLDTEPGERLFHATEHEIEHLAREAWAERILIRVMTERHDQMRPKRIEFLHLPRHRHGGPHG